MPAWRRPKSYAVLCGRYGIDVYDSWNTCHAAVDGLPNAIYKSFNTREDAWRWINERGTSHLVTPDEPADRSMHMQDRSRDDDAVEPAADASMATIVPEHLPLSPPLSPTLHVPPPPTIPPPTPITLTDEQWRVVDLCERGHSIFFTGSAGTGKSVCLRTIIERLQIRYPEKVYVTASTGIAAINVGGTTLHSYAGIQLGKENINVLVNRVQSSNLKRKKWQETKVLIIDEISMIDGRLFDKLEELARMVRNSEEPFGGIQLIICGDFFQLPPVPDIVTSAHGQKIPPTFAFDAKSWNRCIKHTIVLTQVFRQKQTDFVTMLNMMRLGEMDPLGLSIFRRLDREVPYEDGIQPTELFSLRAQVEEANNTRLRALPGEDVVYYATDYRFHDMFGKEIPADKAVKTLDNTMAPRELRLRVGAQVMLTKNPADSRLVNGSLGTIVAFETTEEAVRRQVRIAQMAEDKNRASNPRRGQFNPKDAYLGRSDDPYLEKCRIKSSGPPPPTAAVATAAAAPYPTPPGNETEEDEWWRDLDEIEESAVNGERETRQPEKSEEKDPSPRWPTVQFTSGEVMQFGPASFEVVNARGKREVMRMQVPLILAWALSIHKSQGQTLERVKVNLQGIFEKGQAYVAVSRATSLEALQVLNFDVNK
ncbi:hypothetical protein FRC16_005162 [Serendipita sp. 398]|nr:hypothetical protein FRC16_005162 [Serendipita sp. 398]